MDNLLESNERTLVIFEAVCSGLAECLALVHADIKSMTEHRNQLAEELEFERQAAGRPGGYAETDLNGGPGRDADGGDSSAQSSPEANNKTLVQTDFDAAPDSTTDANPKQQQQQQAKSKGKNKSKEPADPSQLAQLKLLDKRLADSFSQALSMCDQQRSSLAKQSELQRQVAANGSTGRPGQRPSIFQMLLGRGLTSSNKRNKSSSREDQRKGLAGDPRGTASEQPPDNRLVIDDINRQTRLAMQYSKQLEAHLFRVEELRARYEMHLKMGLVVKSVSRAYLPSVGVYGGPSPAAATNQRHSPNSLGARRVAHQHHSSSLMVNDSSSLGTTRSSLSSLNLSTWSFSRRQNSDRHLQQQQQQQAQHRKHSVGNHHLQPPGAQFAEGHQFADGGPTSPLGQRYVSTISLDSITKQQQQQRSRPNSSKAISANVQQVPNYPPLLDGQQRFSYQRQAHSNNNNNLAGPPCECQCGQLLGVDSPGSPAPAQLQASPRQSRRPMSQYVYGTTAEFATPTTTGTLASSAAGELFAYSTPAAGGRPTAASPITGGFTTLPSSAGCVGSLGGALKKSASHSSLKKLKGSHKLGGGLSAVMGTNGLSSQTSHGGKTTIKEFIDNIERIEAEFETYMGSFMMNIEDIQGFARVCQGDVFEINIRYGPVQKFKTRISVLKDNRQKCDHKQTVFKARIADVIAIKAYECKGLGKRVLLGHKLCETRDLFMARSQLMTISLNQTGSIKLNLVITWNPLHMTPNSSLALQPGLEISHISLPPTPISSSTLSSVSSAQSNSTNGGGLRDCKRPNQQTNKNNNTTMISIQSGTQGSRRRDFADQQQFSPSPTDTPAIDPATVQHQQYHYQHPATEHQLERVTPTKPQTMYKDADTTYGYYIPEPDYLAGDLKY